MADELLGSNRNLLGLIEITGSGRRNAVRMPLVTFTKVVEAKTTTKAGAKEFRQFRLKFVVADSSVSQLLQLNQLRKRKGVSIFKCMFVADDRAAQMCGTGTPKTVHSMRGFVDAPIGQFRSL